MVARQPQIEVAWPNSRELGECSARPVLLNSAYNVVLSFNCLRLLMPNGFKIAIGQLGQSYAHLRPVGLAQFIFCHCKVTPSKSGVCSSQETFEFVAAHFDTGIIDSVR